MYHHLILILILATLIGNGSSSRYGSSGVTLNDEMPTAYASRLRSSRKLGIKKVRKGRKAPQTDEEYPDHGQSNLDFDYWGANAVVIRKRNLRLRRLRNLASDDQVLDSLINLMEALSRRPRMRRLLLTTTSMLLSDLSTTLTESKNEEDPKAIKSGLLAGIDTSRDNGASAASRAASEDSDENDTLEEDEYYEAEDPPRQN